MKYKGLILFVIVLSIQSTNLTHAEVSQIHFGSTNTPHEGVTITWTNYGEQDHIQWGYTSSLEMGNYPGSRRTFASKVLFDYTFPILLSDTLIYYSIYDSNLDSWTETRTFRTASLNRESFTFKTMSDSQTDYNEWHDISSVTQPSDFTLYGGDIVNVGGDEAKWDHWFDGGEEFLESNLFYSALGNHELWEDPDAIFFQNLLTLPVNPYNSELYYSFNYKNAVFICLNSNDAWSTDQYNWLLNTLEENKDVPWKIVWFHIPFYTSPTHTGEMDYFFDTWWKAFDDYGVDLIFNGHTHNYQRTVPINRYYSVDSPAESYGSLPMQGRCQIVTGGAGSWSYGEGTGWFIETTYDGLHYVKSEVFENHIDIKAYNINNELIDNFSLVKDFNPAIQASAHSVCDGEPVTLTGTGADTYSWDHGVVNGEPFYPAETTTYTLTASSTDGLSKVLSVEIKVNPKYYYSESQTICGDDSLFWRGKYYHASGTYYDVLQNVYGCDSIYSLHLTVNSTDVQTQETEACEGESVWWRGDYYALPGTYYDTEETAIGCNNTYELILTYNPAYSFNESISLCDGERINWQGESYSEAGTYHNEFTTLAGCDSSYHLTVQVLPSIPEYEISGKTEVSPGETSLYNIPENTDYDNTWSVLNGEIIAQSEKFIEIHWPEIGTGYIFSYTQNDGGCSNESELNVTIGDALANRNLYNPEQEIRIFPNPARDILTIDYPEAFTLEIYAVSGVKMLVSQRAQTDISQLLPGLYILRIRNEENRLLSTSKLIVE